MKAAKHHRRNAALPLNLAHPAMPADRRILIVTAAFGEGHNSAARNLALALDAAGAQTFVADPCMLGVPRTTALVNRGYRLVTTRFPQLWARIYRSTGRCDFSRNRSPLMRLPERALQRLVDEFRPHAVVSTYPLYPYYMPRIDADLPVFTVVTDSIEINAAWLRAPSTAWLVTDPATRDAMIRAGLEAARVIDSGFPVHPVFASMQAIQPDDPCEPFRILYFPTSQSSQAAAHARALLAASPGVMLTIVMGRNARRLLPVAREIKTQHPGRVRLVGWTRKVPRLLASHHLVVGKAGGATVHEAIAARCPMFIHHLVPGQEEGNLRLLETIGGGALANDPSRLTGTVASLLAENARGWRSMKTALARHNRDNGAATAADFILNRIPNPKSPDSNPAA
jgi:processive 1,2-diacylglycerol beta-glucosyltransferase